MNKDVKARAVVFSAADTVEIRKLPVRRPGPGEVLVEAAYTCISPGTELRCLSGKQPGQSYPIVAGYAMTGRVIECGEGAGLPEETPVFLGGTKHAGDCRLQWGGHISHAVTHREEVIPLPESIPLLDASLVKLAAIAVHGWKLGRVFADERVAVVGLGALGQISARLHRLSGAAVLACDLSEKRVEYARKAGIEAVKVTDSIPETLKPMLPRGADVVVDVTGSPPVLMQSLQLVREPAWNDPAAEGSRFIVQGSYPDTFTVPYRGDGGVFPNEVTLLFPRDCTMEDRRAVLRLLEDDRLSLADIISEVRAPEDAAQTYNELKQRDSELLTAAFDWSL